MPERVAGGRKNATTHNGGEPFAPGKSRIGFHSHRECMEKAHEYANELGKQGGKNPRKIPKFSINHERKTCYVKIHFILVLKCVSSYQLYTVHSYSESKV